MTLNYTYIDFFNLLDRHEGFSFSRYGDGEWAAMLEIQPISDLIRNRDGEEMISFSKRFYDIFESNPEYIIGIQGYCIRTFNEQIKPYYEKLKNTNDSDIFLRMSIDIGIDDFLVKLKNRRCIIVGPDYLEKLKLEGYHIKTPYKSWLFYDKIRNELREEINKIINDNPVILYSCTFPTKCLVHENYIQYGTKITQIDVGSLWDPYCGINSRIYHQKILDRINPGSTGSPYFDYGKNFY